MVMEEKEFSVRKKKKNQSNLNISEETNFFFSDGTNVVYKGIPYVPEIHTFDFQYSFCKTFDLKIDTIVYSLLYFKQQKIKVWTILSS